MSPIQHNGPHDIRRPSGPGPLACVTLAMTTATSSAASRYPPVYCHPSVPRVVDQMTASANAETIAPEWSTVFEVGVVAPLAGDSRTASTAPTRRHCAV